MNVQEIEQFVLTQLLERIVKFQEVIDATGEPYSNIIRIIGKEPQLVFNKLLACEPDVYQFFNDLTSLQKGYMVPKIEIYKKDKNGKDIPLKFKSFFDSEEYTKYAFNNDNLDINTLGRQDGAGLKKISITDRNENQSDVNIEVKIDLFFDNVLALANSSFRELITVPKIRKSTTERDFRIKLVVGWETPIDASGNVFSTEQLDIIERSNIVYLLNLTTHTINFRENGNIDISVVYQGSTEKTFSSNSDYDILSITDKDKRDWFETNVIPLPVSYKELSDRKENIEKEIERLNTNVATGEQIEESKLNQTSKDRIAKIEKEKEEIDKKLEELELLVIKSKYSLILEAIAKKNRICYIDIPQSFAEQFAKEEATAENKAISAMFLALLKTTATPKVLIRNAAAITSTDAIVSLRTSATEPNPKELQVVLDAAKSVTEAKSTEEGVKNAAEDNESALKGDFSVMDRMEAMVDIEYGRIPKNSSVVVSDSQHAKDITGKETRIYYITLGDLINTLLEFLPTANEADIILGPCKIGNRILNLAQFPISINNFAAWFNNNVVKAVRKSYFLWDFIKDLANDLIKSNLMGFNSKGSPETYANILVSSVNSDKQLFKGNVYIDTQVISGLSRNINNTEKIYSYFVIYLYDYNMDRRYGDLKEDMANGIYHFSIGRNAGILKNASFNKIDFPRYRDMRLVDGQLQSPGSLLKEHYSMDMKTIGCPIFVNGMTLYFDASYLGIIGRKASEDLGLGGYYLVTGIETTISTEGYENAIKAVWNVQRSPNAEEISTMVMSEIENAKQLGLQSLKSIPDPSITRGSDPSFFGKF